MKKLSFIFALFLAVLLAPQTRAEDTPPHLRPTEPPQKLPSLVFEDADGAQHALSDYRGRFVLLNIWATWCSPCVKEMPSLEALEKHLGSPQFMIVPLSEDRGEATVSAFYQHHALTHLPVAIDHAGTAPSALHLHGLPTSLLIDPQGREIARIEGDIDWNSPEPVDFIRSRLSASSHP